MDKLDQELLPNSTLSHYRVEKKIGAGGMGEVYLAHDTKLDRKVALKILPTDVDQTRMRRFVQEAKAASALNHPNIITIHEIEQIDSMNFIAIEFIDGETLRHRISTGMTQEEILEVAIQVASALDAAHEAGIIHRDIKPENIMIRRDGYVKVLDFGLAKLAESRDSVTDPDAATKAMVHTSAGTVMGTAVYMSPEQAKGATLDKRTDLWSLGAVLYEMVTGRLPFFGETATDTISLIIQREPAPLSRYAREVPGELERIVNKALTKNREERYQSAKDLLIDLRNLKRKLEVDAEINRTVAPEFRDARPTRPTVSGQDTPATASAVVGDTHGSSNGAGIVSGIKQHKLAALVVLLALAIGAVALVIYLRGRGAVGTIDSIAVLPFENNSTEPETEYLSDGLAESLIYRLTQLPNLKVTPTSVVFQYKGKAADAAKVGSELGVNAVLMGRITQRGDTLMISAELIDVRQNKLLWGEQYERKMSELLATQREIAREIVGKLKLKVSGEEKGLGKNYTDNNEAYQLYLKGRFYWNKRSPQGLQKSLEYYNQAIAKDPNFALAYSALADTYAILGGPEAGGELAPNEVLPKAKAAALKALEIDESLAEPHVSLAHVKCFYDRDWSASEREYRRAIELNPNYSVAHHWYAIFLTIVSRHDEALEEIRRAHELEPLSLSINAWYGRILFIAGQPDRAREQLLKTIELDQNFVLAHLRLGQLYEEKGMYEDAISKFNQVIRLTDGGPLGVGALAHAYAMTGRRAEAQKNLDELLQMSENRYVSPTQIAMVYTALGDKDKAFAWLDKGEKAHDILINRLKMDSRFNGIRNDPRFDDLVRRIGLP